MAAGHLSEHGLHGDGHGMSIPCGGCGRVGGRVYRAGDCRFCWLYQYDARYRELWADVPPRWRRVLTFLRALIRHVCHGLPRAIDQPRRMAICRACEHFDAAKTTCRKCGCGLRLKTAWRLSLCPVGRW